MTAFVTPTRKTETALITAPSGQFLDLVEIMCVNTTGVSMGFQVRPSTAGGVVRDYRVPTFDSKIETFTVPIPQPEAGATWTIQMDDPGGEVSDSSTQVYATFVINQ